jgi:phage protein U
MTTWATLGETEIEVLSGPSAFGVKYASNFADIPLIGRKSALQHTGFAPDEISWAVRLNAVWSNPADELRKLKEHMDKHNTLSLVMGTGEYRGVFVIKDLDVALQHTDPEGNILDMELNMSLQEYTGDPAKPNPPGVIKDTLPIGAFANPTVLLSEPPGGFLETLDAAMATIETIGEASARVNDIVASAQNGDILGAVSLAGAYSPELFEMAQMLPIEDFQQIEEIAVIAQDAGEVATGLSAAQTEINTAALMLEQSTDLGGLSAAAGHMSGAVGMSAGTQPALERLQAWGEVGSRLGGPN